MLNFFQLVSDRANRALGDRGLFSSSQLAPLNDDKAFLGQTIKNLRGDLIERASQGLLSKYFHFYGETTAPFLSDDSYWASNDRPAQYQLIEGNCYRLWVTKELAARRKACTHCGSGAGFFKQETPLGCAILVTKRCRTCGATEDWESALLFLNCWVEFVSLLAKVAMSATIAQFEALFRFVAAAVKILLARLRVHRPRTDIVVSQRNFFTHHGAHPPHEALRAVEASCSGVFEPHFAI